MQNFNINTHIRDVNTQTAKTNIDKYFIPLTNGTHAILRNGTYQVIDKQVLKDTYFNRFPKDLQNYYFREKTDLLDLIYDINKPVLTETTLNLCPRLKHAYQPYESFSDSAKQGVQLMLDHLKYVLCDSNNDTYTFFLKWYSNLLRGNKNSSALSIKGLQGSGKTTVFEFTAKHVIGGSLCLETGSGPIVSKFNSELAGKLLVVFEELESFGVSEWMSISSKLKRMITSDRIMIEAKGENAIEHANINNYVIISNNEVIQDEEGRRYFTLVPSTKYMGDHAYFDKLYNTCFNDDVGHAFFCYMLEIDLTGYNAQKYPITSSKLDAISKRLDSPYRFLKDEYVLKSIGINKLTLSELYEEYKTYCTKTSLKIKGKIDFNGSLKSVNIIVSPSNGKNYFTMTKYDLNKLSNKNHWVHCLDTDKVFVKPVVDKSLFEKKPLMDDYENGNVSQELLKQQLELMNKQNKLQKSLVKTHRKNCETLMPLKEDEVHIDVNDFDDIDEVDCMAVPKAKSTNFF